MTMMQLLDVGPLQGSRRARQSIRTLDLREQRLTGFTLFKGSHTLYQYRHLCEMRNEFMM